MKKLLLVLSLCALNPLLASYHDDSTDERPTKKRRTDDGDYCQECCAEGRYVTAECGRKCHGCTMRSDEAAQEWRDYPS